MSSNHNHIQTTEMEELKNNEINEEEIPIIEEEPEENIRDIKIMKAYKRHLMFEEKDIGIFQLIFHLSYPLEIFLMVLGVIGSFGSGASMPIIALLVGRSVGEYSKTSESRTGELTPIEKRNIFSEFKDDVDDTVYKFLYIGAAIAVATFLSNFLWEYVGLKQVYHLKEKYFTVILKQEQGYFDVNNPYEFSTKVQAQVEQIEFGLGEKIGQTLEMIAQFVSGLIISFITSWEITLILLTLSPALAVCFYCILVSIKRAIVLSRKAYEKAGGIAEEVLYNIKTVVSFSNFEFEEKRFNERVDLVFQLEQEKTHRFGAAVAFLIFFTTSIFAITVLYARNLIADEDINHNTDEPYTGGDVLTVNMAFSMAVMSIDNLAPNMTIIQEACQASSDYFTLCERKSAIDESRAILTPDREKIKGKIEFRNITFTYPSDKTKTPVLKDLNIIIEPGQKVAIVGESGCGKSTTVNLIERLYEAEKGNVFLDDINIKDINLKHLRSLIGYVQQEPILFNNSIRDNIIFGRQQIIKEEFGGDEQGLMERACSEAYAEEFIQKKEEKYDYVVGIKGSKLSGGQKQRIAIARAILLKPKILILDEATSALDNQSEKEVQRALDNISGKNVTTIIIAHRLSTIKNADVIFALKKGKVVEKGTHEELLALDGYYANLVKSQIAQEEFASDDRVKIMQRKKSATKEKKAPGPKGGIKKKPIEKKVGFRLFSLLSDYKGYVALGSIFCLLYGAVHPLNAFVRAKCVNALSDGDKDVVRDNGVKYGCIYFAIAVGSAVFLLMKILSFQTVGSVISAKLRKIVISKYLKLHMGFFDLPGNAPGALLARLSIDTTQMSSLVNLIMGDIIQTAGALIVGLIIGIIYDYRLILIGLCFTPFIVAAHIIMSKTRITGRSAFRAMNVEAGAILSESVINTKSIFAFNFQEPAVKLYMNALEAAKRDFLQTSIFKGFIMAFGQFALYAGRACLYHFAGVYISNGTCTFEDFNIVVATSLLLNQGCSDGLRDLGLLNKAKLAFNSIFSIIDAVPEVDVTEEGNKDKVKPNNLKGKIEFKNVSFAYPTKPDHMILKNVNITIEPGQSAALVGFSGCGKSTIIQLIERFYNVDDNHGQILIDGINIKDYDITELRKRIGLVSQEPVLFKRNVYNNILYGNLNASKKDVYLAAKRACIEKFFSKKNMGTKESPVSGGEKQRLAIARAFLKDPKILLLDEATSALDKESEKEVQKSIDDLMVNRTSVTVAHRLSTIVNSDIIFVLEDGVVVEQGTHEELMKLGKKYSYLYRASQCG
ncbi:MAG: ATP-binding cassette domain-containing protein [archaeon]|nr:ATP-binding cassette domain-containing protein [archaeon]